MSETITEYTEYFVDNPGWFIDTIGEALGRRDISGITGGRFEAIAVSEEHPLVQLTGSIMKNGEPDHAGLIPAISVIEQPENEFQTTMGDGMQVARAITWEYLQGIRTNYPHQQDRVKEGLITDDQITLIETALEKQAETYSIPLEETSVKGLVDAYWIQESAYVSLWCHSINERKIIGSLLRSILFAMRKPMRQRGLRDITMRTSKGLVNFNFGRILHGQESEISFLNRVMNINVTDESGQGLQAYVIAEFTTRDDSDYITNDSRTETRPNNPDGQFVAGEGAYSGQ